MKSVSSKMTPYLFILPSMAFLFLFYYYAVYIAFIDSFSEHFLGFERIFIGFNNYIAIFSDKIFLYSLKNQLVLTLSSVFVNIFFPFVAAELLHSIRRQSISQAIKKLFVIPMLVPGIVTIMIWKFLYGNNYGINNILEAVGLGRLSHDWLNDSSTALWTIIFVGLPFVSGLYFLIIHAAINTIPKEFHEAAIIDGCKTLDIVRYIHIPHLRPYISMIVTLIIIDSLQNYGKVLATTRGGPGFDTIIPGVHIYNVAFSSNNFGYGSALGMVFLLIIVALTVISRKLTRVEKN